MPLDSSQVEILNCPEANELSPLHSPASNIHTLFVACSPLSHVPVPLQKAVRVLHACVAQPDLTFFAPPAAVILLVLMRPF